MWCWSTTKGDGWIGPADFRYRGGEAAAGDAFIGGLAVALVKGFPLDEAVRYASCAGALAVTKFGAQTSLPSADEVQAFYESGVAEL